jgi:fragile X mental retardation protein
MNYSEIVTKDRIRHVNTNPYLKTNPFFKFRIDVPKEMAKNNLSFISKSETHKHLKKALGIIAIRFDELNNQLLCIGYAENEKNYWSAVTKKRALLLSDMHFRSLQQKIEVMAKNEALRQKLNYSSGELISQNGKHFELNVRVSQDLIGLAIGTNGSHLKLISKIPGIISIENNKGIFRITGIIKTYF